MGSIRRLESKGTLFLDFRYAGQRLREYTTLPDTSANRKRLLKVLERIEGEIALGAFDYQKTFGKPLPAVETDPPQEPMLAGPAPGALKQPPSTTPLFSDFAEVWFVEAEVTWRRSYSITQRGALDKYLIPFFGDKEVGQITKADVLAFRASLAKVPARKSSNTLSNRRINSIMKPLRQILNEAADRFEFTSAFRNIKPLKMKRSDVMPFTLEDVQRILSTAREDYRNYFTVRFFTGMRTGEVHGLKWKYIDFERRLILVRESIVLNEEDELKTDGSMRDIQMNEMVFDALQEQCEAAIDRLRLVPALPTLAYRGVANDEAAKRAFHREGRVALRALADALGLPDSGYTLTARRGTLAQSGEIILHGDELRVRLSLDIVFPGEEVTYCRVRGRDDHWGDRDRRAPLINLLDPARFAARLRRELTLTPAAEPMALVA